ncbi:MAG: hypothetical protein ACTSRS_11460 [Candidatus Helarchaeota archaeon]
MNKEQALEEITSEINKKLRDITGIPVFTAIIDPNGKILVADTIFEPLYELISNFVRTNFSLLDVGDHSIPISGNPLVFFRMKNGIIALYSPKGRHGALLSFQSQFTNFQLKIDTLIGEITPQAVIPEKGAPTPAVKYKRDPWKIPVVSIKKLQGNEKLSLKEALILNKCNENPSIQEILDISKTTLPVTLKILQKYENLGWISFPYHYLISTRCPICKAIFYSAIPKEFLDQNPAGYVRLEYSRETCDHSYYLLIDQNLKIKKTPIESFIKYSNTIDFATLTLESFLQFFGEDVSANIFHTLLLNHKLLLVESADFREEIMRLITEFLRKIFPKIEEKVDIKAISRIDYIEAPTPFKDWLVLDLATNIVINEPFKEEKFTFLLKMLKEALKEKDMFKQVLHLNQEVEQLLLLTDPLITIADKQKKIISEADVLKKLKTDYKIEISLEELQFLKKLIKAYFNIDVSKKIVSELAYSLW